MSADLDEPLTGAEQQPTESELAEASARLKDALTRFITLIEPIRIELWDKRGLTVSQLRLLFAVRDASGASIGEVGQAIGLGGSSLTGLVDRVAALGLIRREPDVHDRRIVRLALAEAGAALLAELEAERETDFSAVLASLAPSDRVQLAALFEQFMASAESLAARRVEVDDPENPTASNGIPPQ